MYLNSLYLSLAITTLILGIQRRKAQNLTRENGVRTFLGIAILLVGWINLGLMGSGSLFAGWTFGKDAQEIETYITQQAEEKIGRTTYGVQTAVSGRDITVSGTVANEIERAAILANVDSIDGRRIIIDDLKLIHIASPYIFNGRKSVAGLVLKGNAPTDTALSEIMGSVRGKLTLAGGMPDMHWPDFVARGLRAIDMLEKGEFAISDRTMQITGLAASFEREQMVRDVFAGLPAGYEGRVNLDVAPTVPYVFNGSRDGGGDTYDGYVPSSAARGGLAGLIGDAAQSLKPTAGVPDDKWLSVVGVSVKAMKSLNEGNLSVVDRSVSLTGSVNSPDAISTIKDLFSTMPDGYSAKIDLTSVDDGTPVALDFEWVSGKGGTINGKGPEGVSLDDLTIALKLPKLDGIFRQGKVPGKEAVFASFTGIASALPLLESAQAQVSADGVSLRGVLLPGGDMEIAEATLIDALGDATEITLTRSALEPSEGDIRSNVDTGKDEIYRGGFWLVIQKNTPVTTPQSETDAISPTPADVLHTRCVAATTEIMAHAEINFETGSAVLTSQSQALLQRLGAVMQVCAGVDGLTVEVGGHTDSQGSEEGNLGLSQQRADAVRQALIETGVIETAVTAIGFGETQPITTNETAEGRAQNRRTTFTWVTRSSD
jgi:OOP family OmpA-OmpF porin